MKKIFSLLFICIVVVTMCAVIRVDAESPINPHIKAVYEYKVPDCIAGRDAGCIDIISTKAGTSAYDIGTIIKYEVKDGEERYFSVIKDNGSTLTLQEASNTVGNVKWSDTSPYDTSVIQEPTLSSGYALYEIEQIADDWEYVNIQNYSIGDDTTTLGYSGCNQYNNCSTTTYTLNRTARARMITVQELVAANCSTDVDSCSMFDGEGGSYFTLNASGSLGWVWQFKEFEGKKLSPGWCFEPRSARAVVVIDKATPEVTPPTPSESDATPEEGEVVNAEDTLRMSYIGYIMGIIVIFAGSYVIYLAIEKKYEDIEE